MQHGISNDYKWGRVGKFVEIAGLYLFCLYSFCVSTLECSKFAREV